MYFDVFMHVIIFDISIHAHALHFQNTVHIIIYFLSIFKLQIPHTILKYPSIVYVAAINMYTTYKYVCDLESFFQNLLT